MSTEGMKNPPREGVTLAEVARRAGCSKMTASRALSGKGYVSEERARRVRLAAELCGYRVNPLVRTLMAGVRRQRVSRRANLAWVTFGLEEARRREESLQAMLGGARTRAEELGFGLAEVDIPGNAAGARRIAGILKARGAAGAILAPLPVAGRAIDFPWDDFPVAAVGASVGGSRPHRAMAHSVHMMGEILDRLAERGYERVGYLTLEDIDLRIERGREMVWDHRQAKIPRGRRIPAAFVDGWRPADLAAWLEKKRPDALVLGDPGLLRVLDKTGWKAPVALGVATTRWSKAELRCAGMRQPFGELGAAAVDLVVGQIHRNEAGLPKVPVTVMVDGEWIEGASLPPRRHRANAG